MAEKVDIFFWVFLAVSLTPVLSQTDELFFRGFTGGAGYMTLDGSAEILDSGVLKLTNDSLRVVGHAFYSSPIRFKNGSTGKFHSFSTVFAFAIIPEYPKLGGHGFAFTISPSGKLLGSLPSQYLGLMNKTDVGNFSNHIFAVEFDTVQDFEFNDISDNHVGIDINSLVSNKSAPVAYYSDNSTRHDISLKSGEVILAWVDYDSLKNQLDVRISESSVKPRTPMLSCEVDLSKIFDDYMYVGFSASTGLLSSYHYVLGWSFAINEEARSFDLTSLPSLPRNKKTDKALIIGVSVSAVLMILLVSAVAVYIVHKIRNSDAVEAWELDVGPHRFRYRELKAATRGFRDKELLGFGAFGRVYRGTLPSTNTQVAVKRISNDSKQGLREFVSEIATIGRLRHRNLVQLLGWCRRRSDLLIVYDFMPNGSLDKYLFDEPKSILTWQQRFKIIKGVASGLLYLHEEWEQTVIHRDIKAGNILLDGELNGRLGDFGLAKLYEHGANPSTTRVVGTLGYLAPELTRTGKPTLSSDVFAFGALLLEVVCGRRPVEAKALPEELILVDWVWDKWVAGAILEVVDLRLGGQFDEVEAVVVLKLGLMCSNNSPEMRPSMRQVVRFLEGELTLPHIVPPPDGNYAKKGGPGGAGEGRNLDDYVHSYETSSYFEKVTTWSVDGENDPEAGSDTSGSGRSDHR